MNKNKFIAKQIPNTPNINLVNIFLQFFLRRYIPAHKIPIPKNPFAYVNSIGSKLVSVKALNWL